MNDFSTIHIFGYGEAQIISKDVNFKAKHSDFTKLEAVIADVKSKRPADKADVAIHAINIFKGIRVDYTAKEKEGSFSCKVEDLDVTKLNDLVAEFAALKTAAEAPTPA